MNLLNWNALHLIPVCWTVCWFCWCWVVLFSLWLRNEKNIGNNVSSMLTYVGEIPTISLENTFVSTVRRWRVFQQKSRWNNKHSIPLMDKECYRNSEIQFQVVFLLRNWYFSLKIPPEKNNKQYILSSSQSQYNRSAYLWASTPGMLHASSKMEIYWLHLKRYIINCSTTTQIAINHGTFS